MQPSDDHPHPDAAVDEWVFAGWTDDARIGFVSGHRLLGRRAWYWTALVEQGRPLLHLAEWDVAVRADPFVVKAPEMWAEHHCVAALEQWTIGNEAYAAELDDPDEALGRAYGTPTPMAFDLEWYATGEPVACDHGFEQPGVVHGTVEVLGRVTLDVAEIAAHRWRRWNESPDLAPVEPAPVVAHHGLRAPFVYPDGTSTDWVLTPRGWRTRARRRPGSRPIRRPTGRAEP